MDAIRFQVFASSGVPIYRQIMDQVRALIAGGELRPGDSPPSVRDLAAHLQVNPMTVSKAFSLLENDGVLRRARGLGMHVAKVKPLGSVVQRQNQLRSFIEQVAAQAHQLGLTREQTRQVIDRVLKEYFP